MSLGTLTECVHTNPRPVRVYLACMRPDRTRLFER